MGHDDRREIFERLAALERMVQSRREGWGRGDRDRGDRHHSDHRHDRDRGRDRDRGPDDFEEKRIIDTIVHLVTENVGRMLEEREQPRREDGDEKRIIDLIVRLVSEHVREIVATELDSRLGPARNGDDDSPPPPSSPPARRGRSSESDR